MAVCAQVVNFSNAPLTDLVNSDGILIWIGAPKPCSRLLLIWRGTHTAWPTGPESHPQKSQITTFQGKQARGRAAREAPQDSQIIIFQVKGRRGRDARETAGDARGGGGGQARALSEGEPGTHAEAPKKLKKKIENPLFFFSSFSEIGVRKGIQF